MAKGRRQKSGKAYQVQGVRIGPLCQSVMEVQKGDQVVIDPDTDDQTICHRLGLTKEELGRQPIRVIRVEPANGRIVLGGRRIDGVNPDQIRKVIAFP